MTVVAEINFIGDSDSNIENGSPIYISFHNFTKQINAKSDPEPGIKHTRVGH